MIINEKVGDILDNTQQYKCPKCSAILKFDGYKLQCEYCKNEFNIEEFFDNNSQKNFNKYIYFCQKCGVKFIADSDKMTNSCIYCKAESILINKFNHQIHSDYIIPFKFTKEVAINSYKNFKQWKIFKPKEFNNKKNIEEMHGIYIPYYLFNCNANGIAEYDCKKNNTFKSGKYKYIKTDTYSATRVGHMCFEHILINGSKNFNNSIINFIEPYN